MTVDCALHLSCKAPAAACIINGDVIDVSASSSKLLSKMAHRREYQGDLAFMMAHICRLIHYLHKQNHRIRRTDVTERCQFVAELIAEDRNEDGHAVFQFPNGLRSYRMLQRPEQVMFAHDSRKRRH